MERPLVATSATARTTSILQAGHGDLFLRSSSRAVGEVYRRNGHHHIASSGNGPHLDTAAHDGASPSRSRPDTRRRSCRKCSCRSAAVGMERRAADTHLHLKHMKPTFEPNSTAHQAKRLARPPSPL